MVFEDAVDRLRGRVDAGGSVVAGLAVAGGVGVWHGLGYGMCVRAARRGLGVGVGFGVVQDLLRGGKGEGWGVFEVFGLGRGGGLREALENGWGGMGGWGIGIERRSNYECTI